MSNPTRYRFPFILMTSLFFLWGFAHNLNPILIPHLKKACQLTDLQSAFVDSAFFIGYFVTALPAGLFMKRFGYKTGILTGLCLFAIGAFLFYPAADFRLYGLFLVALFVLASGLTFLETAANPYVTALGQPASATQRLNLAQSFNGLAATLAPFIGGTVILSGNVLTVARQQAMSPDELNTYLTHEAASVKLPYLLIGAIVLAVALLISRSKLPDIAEPVPLRTQGGTESIFRQKNLMMGVTAQFFYVGAQVCISSFFIRFAGTVAAIPEKTGALYLSIALVGFMVGRFIGTALMRTIAPHRLLGFYTVGCVGLLLVAVAVRGMAAVYALVGVEFFMSIMFPTIFSLGIYGLGAQTKVGSSLLIMAIAGGALFPLLMGRISDISSIQMAYIVPALCFIPVLFFALRTTARLAADSN
ncbi:L-fucose:H+ symporter permease [Spirosoma gilvum]